MFSLENNYINFNNCGFIEMFYSIRINIVLKIDLLLYPVKPDASALSLDGPTIEPIMTSKIALTMQMINRF